MIQGLIGRLVFQLPRFVDGKGKLIEALQVPLQTRLGRFETVVGVEDREVQHPRLPLAFFDEVQTTLEGPSGGVQILPTTRFDVRGVQEFVSLELPSPLLQPIPISVVGLVGRRARTIGPFKYLKTIVDAAFWPRTHRRVTSRGVKLADQSAAVPRLPQQLRKKHLVGWDVLTIGSATDRSRVSPAQ